MKTETQNLFRVAIVGAASLKGKELKDVLEERNFPAAEIKLLDDDESLGQLERVQDEVALALLLLRAKKAGPIRNPIATIFEPVSEQGRQGMDELHEQTINLLSFQQMPMAVFDSQVAFNMLDRYGRTSAHPLEATERRIAAHPRRLLRHPAPMPSMIMVPA